MKTLKRLLLVAIVLCVDYSMAADPSHEHCSGAGLYQDPDLLDLKEMPIDDTVAPYALDQFRNIILCNKPKLWPIWDYANYGCYCGKGGSGTPVDDLDRCCQVHDKCYEDAQVHPKCRGFLGFGFLKKFVPYVRRYIYKCDEETNTVTCSETNDECKMFVCECDRKAAECFAETQWNREHHFMNQDRCKE